MKKNTILNSTEIISFKNLLENLPNGPIMNFSTISRSLEKKKINRIRKFSPILKPAPLCD